MKFRNIVKGLISEVRYINPDVMKMGNEDPLLDSEVIRVYHGFYSEDDIKKVLEKGLSGQVRAKRIYSYESGNNPKGLFVTIDLKKAQEFGSGSGMLIEFSSRVSDLEAPVWVDGRSYFVQGEYTKSFKDMEEREQQRLINRQSAVKSAYDYISKSDRPELAESIFDNPEKQALYIGNLNPNMIKAIWYNEKLHKDRRYGGEWERLSRKDFMKRLGINIDKRDRLINYYPNDEFILDEFVNDLMKRERYSIKNIIKLLERNILPEIIDKDDYTLMEWGFYPKQINKLYELYNNGEFEKYINKLKGDL